MGLRSPPCLLLLLLGLLVMVFGPPSAAAACTLPLKPCVTDCSTCVQYDKVPDPSNCRGYYVCQSATDTYPTPFECDPGYVFDAAVGDCVEGDACECPSVCVFDCTEADNEGLEDYSHRFDCQTYYHCDATTGTTQTMSCDVSTPYFDGRQCQTEERRCCLCRPYCDGKVDVLVADPLDCRKYYGCTANGPELHGTCPDGEYFHDELGGCSNTVICNTKCTNVVGSDGCIDPYTCEALGYFAKCPGQCTPDYYYCTAVTDEYQEADSCLTGAVFHPDTHVCVPHDMCP